MIPVIAVSGYPGAGKTSLVIGLIEALRGAARICMDSYERMTHAPIEDIARWMDAGSDIDAFDFPGLEEDLTKLKQGLAIEDRLSKRQVSSEKYVLFETQFGRAHRKTGRHIDLQIWIDVPLDLALARNLKAFVAGFLRENQPDKLASRVRWLHGYLDNYLGTVRSLMAMQKQKVAASADVIIDGQGPLPEVVQSAKLEILRRLT